MSNIVRNLGMGLVSAVGFSLFACDLPTTEVELGVVSEGDHLYETETRKISDGVEYRAQLDEERELICTLDSNGALAKIVYDSSFQRVSVGGESRPKRFTLYAPGPHTRIIDIWGWNESRFHCYDLAKEILKQNPEHKILR